MCVQASAELRNRRRLGCDLCLEDVDVSDGVDGLTASGRGHVVGRLVEAFRCGA